MDDNCRERITSAITLGGFALLIIGLTLLILWPLFVGERWEFYIRLFLALFAANTFANLRVYNATVQNTRFLIKLRESTEKIRQAFPNIDRALRQLQTSIGTNKTATDSLTRATTNTGTKVQELTETINKLKQQRQHEVQN